MRRPSPGLRTRFTSLVAITALAAASLPSLAHADESENIAAARSLGIQGVKLAEEGKCKEAIEKLERAEALYHAPTILGRLGECQVQIGQIVRGTENLNKVVREQLAPNAPKAFVDAQARARRVLDAALPRIGYLTVNIEPAGTQAEVLVGTSTVPPALIGAERPTDPGTHEVTASAPGYLPAKASVHLAEGAHEQVTLKLVPDPNAAVEPAPGPSSTEPPPNTPYLPPADASTSSGGSGGKTAGYILLGLGGAGLIVGSVTGAIAMGDASDLKDKCDDGKPGNCEQSDIDSAKSVALVSTISFGVGLAAGVAGVILLATSGKSESAAPREGVRPYIGLGNVGLTGRF
jgi:hypothetical protein